MRRIPTTGLLGHLLVDRLGEAVGRVDGTWPLDGSGVPEFALVRAGRFGERRLVPLDQALFLEGLVWVPHTRRVIEDGVTVEPGRYLYEQVDRARTYYILEVDEPSFH
jgi:hypothetical protein